MKARSGLLLWMMLAACRVLTAAETEVSTRVLLVRPLADRFVPLSTGDLVCLWELTEAPRLQDAFGENIAIAFDRPWSALREMVEAVPTPSGKVWIRIRDTNEAGSEDRMYLVDRSGQARLRAVFDWKYKIIWSFSADNTLSGSSDVRSIEIPESGTALAQLVHKTFAPLEEAAVERYVVHFDDKRTFLAGVRGQSGLTLHAPDRPPTVLFPEVDFRWSSASRAARAARMVGDGRRALVRSNDGHLYVIGIDGTAATGTEPLFPEQTFDWNASGRVSPDRSFVWVEEQATNRVCLLDFQGARGVASRWIDLPSRSGEFPADDRANSVVVGGATKAWLWDEEPGLFLFDAATGTVASIEPFQRMRIKAVRRLKGGRQVAVIPRDESDKGYFIVTHDGSIANGGRPFLDQIAIADVKEVIHGFSWAEGIVEGADLPTDGTPRYLNVIFADESAAWIVDLDGRKIGELRGDDVGTSVHQVGNFFWVIALRSIKILDQNGERARHSFSQSAEFFASDDWQEVWAVLENHLAHISTRGGRVRIREYSWTGNGIHGIWPCSVPNRAWALGADAPILLCTDESAVIPQVNLGGVALPPAGRARAGVLKINRAARIAVGFQWTDQRGIPGANAQWTLRLVPRGSAPPQPIIWNPDSNASIQRADWPSEWRLGQGADLKLSYRDDSGTSAEFAWPNLTLEPHVSFFASEKGRAVAAWLLIGLLLAGTQLPALSASVNRYAPILLGPVLAGFAAFQKNENWKVDGMWFGALLGLTLVGLTAWGAFDAKLLRRLAGIAPLDRIVPKMLLWPRFRRRFFAEYVARVQRNLDRARDDAKGEHYVPIPAQVLHPPDGSQIAQPDIVLADRLLEDKNGSNVLIESPGGRGKSALMRRVTELALQRFRETGCTPMPIVCTGEGEDWAELARGELGRFALSKAIFDEQLESGFFLLVVDGLSDRDVKPDTLRKFVASVAGEQTRLLCATRPHPALRDAFLSDQTALVVEPLRLDDVSIQLFEENYLGPNKRLNDTARQACRGRDGTYLPVLVRLAIKAEAADLETVADVYAAAFDALVKKTGQRQAAAALCLETYWPRGSRTLSAKVAGHETSIGQLLDAGVLVAAAETKNKANGTAEEVKFFHDSMQSFLTAEGLFGLPERAGWSRLREAAGHSRFVTAQSDLLTDGGSELFQMCVQVFHPREDLCAALRAELRVWGQERHTILSADSIVSALPQHLCSRLPQEYTIPQLLESAIRACDAPDVEETLANLSRLFARLAPVICAARN